MKFLAYYVQDQPNSERARKDLGSLEKELGIKPEWKALRDGEQGMYHFPVFEFSENGYSSRFVGYGTKKTFVNWLKTCIARSKAS